MRCRRASRSRPRYRPARSTSSVATRSRSWPRSSASSGPAARSSWSRASGAGRPSPPAARSTSCRRPRRSATGRGSVAEAPADLRGPARRDRPGRPSAKMLINALNSGARVFMADLEDALSPDVGERRRRPRRRCCDAVSRELDFTSPEGKRYALNAETATLVVRPRGWHLVEPHVAGRRRAGVGEPVRLRAPPVPRRAGGARAGQSGRRSARTTTCPSSRCHLEARLWNDVFLFGQERAGHPAGHHPRDRAHRDDLGGVRDGGDPGRAPRARGGTQRRSLGLHLQPHQGLPGATATWSCPTGRR